MRENSTIINWNLVLELTNRFRAESERIHEAVIKQREKNREQESKHPWFFKCFAPDLLGAKDEFNKSISDPDNQARGTQGHSTNPNNDTEQRSS